MEKRLIAIIRKLWPELEAMSTFSRIGSGYDILGILYSAPLAFAGLIWLIVLTDFRLVHASICPAFPL